MKKLITIFILLSVFAVSAQEKLPKVWLGYLTANQNNPGFINGQVKEMTQITYKAKLVDGKIEKDEIVPFYKANLSTAHARHIFDRSGKLIHKVVYDAKNEPSINVIFNYEKEELTKVFFVNHDTLVFQHNIEMSDGKINKITYYTTYLGGENATRKIIYDTNGFMVNSLSFDKSGNQIYEINWKRDTKGRELSTEQKNKKGEIVYASSHEYEDSWEPIKNIITVSERKEVNDVIKREYEYNDKGNWIKQIRYKNDEPLNITFRTYKFFEERKEIQLPDNLLSKYVGVYQLNPDFTLTITKEGEQMFAQGTNQNKFEITSYAKHKFFAKSLTIELEFQLDGEEVIEVIAIQGGVFKAKKIK